MHHPTDRIAHTVTAFVTPVVEHWLEREIVVCKNGRTVYCTIEEGGKQKNALFNDALNTFLFEMTM